MSSPAKRKYRRHREDGSTTPSPVASPAVQRSWAASGFISSRQEAADILQESIFMTRQDADMQDLLTESLTRSPSGSRLQPPEALVVNPGDVLESSDKNSSSFFIVTDVDVVQQTATDKAGTVKKWSELLNPVSYERIVTGATKRVGPSISDLEKNLSHPEHQQFFGKDGKQNFLALIRNSQVDGPMQRRLVGDSRSVIEADMARQIFLQGCRERCLPPLPVLINCTSRDFPKLDMANLSLGRNYVDVIAMSLTAMTFLKSLDFSRNVLDSRGASVLLSSVAETFIEEVFLDHNRIGKGGIKALSQIILNTPSKQTASCIVQEKPACSFTLPPITSPSKLQIRNVTCCLRVISINDNSLGDHLVSLLLKGVANSNNNRLAELYVRGNDVGNASSAILADLIGQKGDCICRLEVIDVSWNNIQTTGAINLLNAASENGFLKSLSMDFNGIQTSVFPALARCCNGKNAVTYISLKNNSLREDSLKELVSPDQLKQINVLFV